MSKKKHELKKAERMAKKEKRAEGKRQEREDRGTFKEQLANLLFAYKFIYKANKKLFLFRIPLLVLQSAKSVVPIFFVREILNEITEGKSLEKVILYASAMAISSFVIDLLALLFGRLDGREHEIFDFRVKKILAESVMDMSYSTLENPEMQDYVWLARNNQFNKVLQLTTALVG